MKRLSKYIAFAAAALLLVGCLSDQFKRGSAANPPSDVKVEPGDGSVSVTWTNTPGVQYWLFTAQASSVTTENWNQMNTGRALINVTSPVLVSGLTNGLIYSFTVNGRIDDGPGGAGSPSLSAVPRLAGATWTKGAPLANDLRGVVFGTKFVAVGAHGALYSSPDFNAWTPMAWTQRVNPLAALPDLNAAAYGNTKYLAVGAGGAMLSSSDAVTWTTLNSPTTDNLYGVASNGFSAFVAVGEKGTIIVSADGAAWNKVNSGTTNDLFGIIYVNGVYLAVGAKGTLLGSADGANWVAISSNTPLDLYGIAYGADMFASTFRYVAVGEAGTVVTSSDSINWTTKSPLTTSNLKSVTFNRQFVAVADSGKLFTSVDGAGWQAQSSGTTNNLNAITHNLYGLCVVGAAGTNLSSL